MLEVHIQDAIATLSLNHNQYNTLTSSLLKNLQEEAKNLNESKDIKVIILKSHGSKYFSTGLDIEELKENPIHLFNNLLHFVKDFYQLGTPIIAELNGHAIAGGAVLAALADFRLASPNVKIAFNEVKIGISVPGIIIEILNNILKPNDVKKLFLLGEPIIATKALECGLLDGVYSKEALHHKTLALAKKITCLHSDTIRYTKLEHRKKTINYINQNFEKLQSNTLNLINQDLLLEKLVRK